MAIGFREHGTAGLVLSRTASQDTGTASTVAPWGERFLKTQIVVEVDAAAGWGGTVTIAPAYQTAANVTTAVTCATGQMTGAGADKTYSTTISGPCKSIAITVASNDKVMRVYAISYGQVESGAV